MRHSKVLEEIDTNPRPRRAIKASLNPGFFGTCVAWTATFEDYDLGDPCGVGATEAEAIADLMEAEDE